MAEKVSPLNQLKQILLADNKDSISQLESKLEAYSLQWQNENWLIKTIDPVILNLISQKINEAPKDVADAFAPVMGIAIKKQIETAREDIIDALYPVMGQIIRKSIAEAMKNLIQSVNSQIENALSFEMLGAKIKSKFTGVDYSKLLLKQAAQIYQINQIFYIHKETGLLIAHASEKDLKKSNSDIISGMLSAIKDFAKTAFIENGTQDLSEIQYGDFQILMENGRNAYLAIVVTGIYPMELKEKIISLENDLHKKYFQDLRNFDGDMSSFKEIKSSLDTFINTNKMQTAHISQTSNEKPFKGLKQIFILISFIFLIYFSIFLIPDWIEESNINNQLHELFENDFSLKAENIQFDLDGTNVLLTGTTSSWQKHHEIESIISKQPGITKVQNQILVVFSDFDKKNILNKLTTQYPSLMAAGLTDIHFIIDNESLFLEGSVSSQKNKVLIASVLSKITKFPAIINNLEVKNETLSTIAEIENSFLYFNLGQVVISEENLLTVEKVGNLLKTIDFDTLFISGHLDNEGPFEVNKNLARKRAENVKQQIVNYGFPEQKFIVTVKDRSLVQKEKQHAKIENHRRVSFSLK